ncbi:MAG: hypothetical protein V4760_10655 [Bdellovibrionota bacterium]
MKTWIALIAVCFSLNVHAAETVETMPGLPESYDRTEETQLIQNSPAFEASAIVAPLSAEEAYVPPTIMGSSQFRAPGEGSTLAEISISNATSNASSQYDSNYSPVYSEMNIDASFYSFRFSHGLTDRSMIFVDAGFMKTKTDNSYLAPIMNRQGVRDVEIGYLGRSANVRRTWLYGASVAGSPESWSKNVPNSTAFSGAAALRSHIGYERRFSKSTGGFDFALVNTVGGAKFGYFDAQYRPTTGWYFDTMAYFEYPIAPKVGFGVEGGLALDGFIENNNSYRAAAYSTFDIMDDAQFKVRAEGATSTSFNSTTTSTTRVTGILSKAL